MSAQGFASSWRHRDQRGAGWWRSRQPRYARGKRRWATSRWQPERGRQPLGCRTDWEEAHRRADRSGGGARSNRSRRQPLSTNAKMPKQMGGGRGIHQVSPSQFGTRDALMVKVRGHPSDDLQNTRAQHACLPLPNRFRSAPSTTTANRQDRSQHSQHSAHGPRGSCISTRANSIVPTCSAVNTAAAARQSVLRRERGQPRTS